MLAQMRRLVRLAHASQPIFLALLQHLACQPLHINRLWVTLALNRLGSPCNPAESIIMSNQSHNTDLPCTTKAGDAAIELLLQLKNKNLGASPYGAVSRVEARAELALGFSLIIWVQHTFLQVME